MVIKEGSDEGVLHAGRHAEMRNCETVPKKSCCSVSMRQIFNDSDDNR